MILFNTTQRKGINSARFARNIADPHHWQPCSTNTFGLFHITRENDPGLDTNLDQPSPKTFDTVMSDLI
jgi:hypothetical protein